MNRLKEIVSGLGSTVVAFSGGIDSTLVLKVAHDLLGDRVLAVTAVSPTFPAVELKWTRRLCRDIGARQLVHTTNQLHDAEFVRNTSARCYRCKIDLYSAIVPLATRMGFAFVCDGTQLDDMSDDRPGMRAALEYGVRSPLVEARLGKEAIRAAAHGLGLSNWDKPAAACLSSRISRGELITLDRLKRVEDAESFLINEGFRQVRVRDSSGRARIEVGQDELDRLFHPTLRERLTVKLMALGFTEIILDPLGYRQGSPSPAAIG